MNNHDNNMNLKLMHNIRFSSRHLIFLSFTIFISLGFTDLKAQGTNGSDKVEMPELKEELLEMYAEDQKVRKVLIEKMKKSDGPMDMTNEEFAPERQKMETVTQQNSERLKEIYQEHGWPNPQMVGKQGTKAAFMIVQHGDLVLQEKMLPILEKEYEKGRLPGQSLALLTDRVLKKQDKKQIYGTQGDFKNGDIVFYPIKDSASVDQRRKKMGLPPLNQYREMMRKMYLKRNEDKN